MDVMMWLAMILICLLLWWFGFIATKQMRIDKNRERTAKWQAIAARQKAEREAAASLGTPVPGATNSQLNKEQPPSGNQL